MDENVPSAEYVTNFNNGYLISQHMPELGEKLTKAMAKSDRTIGFEDGRRQWLADEKSSRTPSWLRKDWQRDIQSPSYPEKSKDDLEKEFE